MAIYSYAHTCVYCTKSQARSTSHTHTQIETEALLPVHVHILCETHNQHTQVTQQSREQQNLQE
jgi:hypothetical protein